MFPHPLRCASAARPLHYGDPVLVRDGVLYELENVPSPRDTPIDEVLKSLKDEVITGYMRELVQPVLDANHPEEARMWSRVQSALRSVSLPFLLALARMLCRGATTEGSLNGGHREMERTERVRQ